VRKHRTPGIWASAVGVFGYCVGSGVLLGMAGATVIAIVYAVSAGPGAVLLTLIFAVPVGGVFGLLVGVVVGLVLVVLVVIGDRRSCQSKVADAIPWAAVVIANSATLAMFVATGAATVLLTQMCSTALACFGGTRVAKAYLRAEEPRIRQLIH
jgi:hypothetical protein